MLVLRPAQDSAARHAAVTRSSDKIELECVLDMCGDLRIGFLRFSTIKKCPYLLRLDHRELRNS